MNRLILIAFLVFAFAPGAGAQLCSSGTEPCFDETEDATLPTIRPIGSLHPRITAGPACDPFMPISYPYTIDRWLLVVYYPEHRGQPALMDAWTGPAQPGDVFTHTIPTRKGRPYWAVADFLDEIDGALCTRYWLGSQFERLHIDAGHGDTNGTADGTVGLPDLQAVGEGFNVDSMTSPADPSVCDPVRPESCP